MLWREAGYLLATKLIFLTSIIQLRIELHGLPPVHFPLSPFADDWLIRLYSGTKGSFQKWADTVGDQS